MTLERPPKKALIEVALPLDVINRECAREKSLRHGHPSTLHLWWARRPLAACRAVLFASLIADPSSRPEDFPTEEDQEAERKRLFGIIEQLVRWEGISDVRLLEEARQEILQATGGHLPTVLDPFCGGGSVPLEAQRLGLPSHGSDLNPVAVMITKALVEIPYQFVGRPPVNPQASGQLAPGGSWRGTHGLALDVRHYGQWMREQAESRIGELYPMAEVSSNRHAPVIAWLWARTIYCPNPACGAQMPLLRSSVLSTKKGREVHLAPVVDRDRRVVEFAVASGLPEGAETKTGRGAKFRCLVCGEAATEAYIHGEFQGDRGGAKLVALAARADGGRVYLPATEADERVAASATPSWYPDEAMDVEDANLLSGRGYGFGHWHELFTARQLVALTTFTDLVKDVRNQAIADGADPEYAAAIGTYLAFAVDRSADYWSTITTWHSGPKMEALRNTLARQAIPMTWDFAEANPFSDSSGNWGNNVEWVAKVLDALDPAAPATASQRDATEFLETGPRTIIATDPPYYDNISYANLSDFFYVWLRRSIGDLYPDIMSTLLSPKGSELIAAAYRQGGSGEAKRFFEEGLGRAFALMRKSHDHEWPMIVFYAFKQTETTPKNSGRASTGWETMLQALLTAGFSITGTWPVRSELTYGLKKDVGALASSIVLVCRPRPDEAPLATRRDLLKALHDELPGALRTLQRESIAPVDLAQASIGPGMGVYSRYSKVLEADGSRLPVRTALTLINQVLDEVLAEQEAEYDAETRFAVAWFEQYGLDSGPFGEADVLARAKNISVEGVVEAGIAAKTAGRFRLLRRDELDSDWDPKTDTRLTVWDVAQHLVRRQESGGEIAAAALLGQVGGIGEIARDLAYRLFAISERKGWTGEALGYNDLVVAWPEISRLAIPVGDASEQTTLGG